MAFSSKNGVEMCDIVSFNNISRAGTSSICGITQGVSCDREPIITDGPALTKELICADILDAEPTGGSKFSTEGAPGSVTLSSNITTSNAESGGNALPIGWYVFWGPDGPGYEGYQIVRTDGVSCNPVEITTCP